MISFSQVSKHYSSKILYQDANFQINPGEKIGLVGANGSGKTTIFRLITGEERPESGTVSVPNKCVVSYFSQDIAEMKGRTVLEEVKSAVRGLENIQAQLAHYEEKLADAGNMPEDEMMQVMEKYGDLQSEFERLGGYDLESRAQEILTGLRIMPEDHYNMVESFSGGWKMRIALAKVLIVNPDVLLMDEPTNHLDYESIIWLEEFLRNFKGAILMTSHDRDFMNAIVSKIYEVFHKQVHIYSGNYDYYEKEREIRKEQLLAAHKRQQDMLAKEEEFIARFAARASHAAQVQSRVKKIEKIDRIDIPAEEQSIAFEFAKAARGGDDVVKIQNLKKIWTTADGREKLVFQNANALVNRQQKIAVVGVNGAGKSTLLKIIADHTKATEGECSIGPSIQSAYFSQSSMDVLDHNNTVFEEIQSKHPTASQGLLRSILGAFLFTGDDVDKKISVLSGGEKSRLVLACMLAKPVNFLVLDEPTNHLDIKSREMLLEALKKFDGSIMIVSHDRYFLRSLADRVFELDKNQLLVYEGNFEYYLWKKQQEA